MLFGLYICGCQELQAVGFSALRLVHSFSRVLISGLVVSACYSEHENAFSNPLKITIRISSTVSCFELQNVLNNNVVVVLGSVCTVSVK